MIPSQVREPASEQGEPREDLAGLFRTFTLWSFNIAMENGPFIDDV
jgi:hypothetical protein